MTRHKQEFSPADKAAPQIGDWILCGDRLVKLRTRAEVIAHRLAWPDTRFLGRSPRAEFRGNNRLLAWPSGAELYETGRHSWVVTVQGDRPIQNWRIAGALWNSLWFQVARRRQEWMRLYG